MTTYETLVADARAESAELVQVDRGDAHAIVRMHDPERLNALSAPLTLQLLDALESVLADPAVRAVVLTGSDPAFSAGGDLRLMRDHAHPMVDESPEGATDACRHDLGPGDRHGGVRRADVLHHDGPSRSGPRASLYVSARSTDATLSSSV